MALDLSESLSIRDFRLDLAYSAARLAAVEETRHLALDFSIAAEKLAALEEEEARLHLARVESQAMVETADDAWDDAMHAFQRRLLDLAGNNTDHELYRRYFAEIPSNATALSYSAEIMISQDLEEDLALDATPELAAHAERLAERRRPLEAALRERTRLEVETAKFHNRVALAKALANKLRRTTWAVLEELALARGRSAAWAGRFFRGHNRHLESADGDGVQVVAGVGANNHAPAEEPGEAAAVAEL